MIRNSFIVLKGISSEMERKLWGFGIKDWNDFVNEDKIKGISKKRKLAYDFNLYQMKDALLNHDSKHFSKLLPKKEHWRLYDSFKDSCIFLDIETSSVNGYITCMTLYDGYETMTFVRNHNLDFSIIKKIISRYRMIVTFNGNVFDLPFLRKYCPDVIPDTLFWDLRHSCAKIGFSGGLKNVENKLGIKRDNFIVEKLHGGDPLKLWRMYLGSGDKYYLELLVEYNQEDAVNLKVIADTVYEMMKKDCEI
ncbi:MAG: ribonuclease H-like domain-containing protein [Candidatus Woesearchaeota archaeon]